MKKKRNPMWWFPGWKLLITAAVAMVYSINVSAQVEIGHGAQWWGVKDKTVLKAGETVLLCWGENGNDKIKTIYIILDHVSGFKNNNSEPVVNENLVYHVSRCGGYSFDASRYCKDINLCPRTGEFKLTVAVAIKKGGKCPVDSVAKIITFTVEPDINVPIPKAVPVSTVCPEKWAKLYVDSTTSGQNGSYWYNNLIFIPGGTSNFPEVDGYNYPVYLRTGEIKTKYVNHYKEILKTVGDYSFEPYTYKDVKCRIEGVRVPVGAIGSPLILEESPKPVFRNICGNDSITFLIDNPGGKYDGVYWYEEVTGAPPIHDKFEYKRAFTDPVTNLYIAYYKKIGADCEMVSTVKAPVVVMNFDGYVNAATSGIGVATPLANYTITDYRDVSGNLRCNEPGQEGKYWVDLENKSLSNDVANFQTRIMDVVNSTPRPPGMTITLRMSDMYWKAFNKKTRTYEKYNIYLDQNPQKIVCADFIAPKGSSDSRTYEKWAKISVSAKYFDPLTQDTVHFEEIVCQERLLAMVTIKTQHPQETPVDYCTDLNITDVTEWANLSHVPLLECDLIHTKSICPGSVLAIGPSDAEVQAIYRKNLPLSIPIPGTVSSAQWSPTDGISNPQALRPNLIADQIVLNNSRFKKYDLIITYSDGVKGQLCTVVYVCEKCGKKPNIVPPDVE